MSKKSDASDVLGNSPSHGVIAREQAPRYQFLAPQFDNLPEELKKQPRWVVWRAEGGAGLKPTKVPYDPTLSTYRRASSIDPQTWGTYEQAVAAYMEGGYTGVAIVLDGDGIVGIDIDHCMIDDEPSLPAMSLMHKLGVEYIEVSPSGTGLRGFGYAEQLQKGVSGNLDGLKVELYSNKRYLTITGRVLKSGPFARLNGFTDLANTINANKVSKPAGVTATGTQEERLADWMGQVFSGDFYHDSLRNLAGSFIASGMQPGAVVSSLRGLMHSSRGRHDDRWKARMSEIPKLVDSAVKKFSPEVVDHSRLLRPTANAANDSEPTTRFKVLTAEQMAQAEFIKWTIRGLLPQIGLAALFGPSGSGKSFLTLDLSVSIASGVPEWYGMRVTQCPVTYCVLEGEGGMGKRVVAWEKYRGQKMPDTLRFIAQQFDLTVATDVEELAIAIRSAGGANGLIVLDTLNRATPGSDENSSKDMGVIIANTKALQQLTGGMVLLVHHTGKDESKGMRGHSSLFAAMDCVIGVVTGKGLSWTVAKSKDDVTGTLHGFRLEQVVVGEDEDGSDITSCVAVSTAPAFAQCGSKKLGQNQQIARDVLCDLFNCNPDGLLITYGAAYDAVADAMDVEPKRKRERAKKTIATLARYGMIEMTDTHIKRLPALGD
ncbi:AAA family ATPase [Massilia horti]|nr:AAA family ATPase [Massilia horti]